MRAKMTKALPLQAHVLERVAGYLGRLGNAQGPLAEKLGIRQQDVSRLKRRQWKNPPMDVLDGVARAFGTTLAEILTERVDARPDWEIDLYAAVARLDRAAAEHVRWLLAREDARQGAESDAQPPQGRKRSTAATRTKRATND